MDHLLLRSPLLPGESLPSFVRRLGILNGYDPPSIVKDLCMEGLRDRHFVLPTQAAIFGGMAGLARIDPAKLYAATAHCFAKVLTPPESSFDYMELGGVSVPLLARAIATRQIRPEAAAQFCPDCLKEAAYHRFNWLPVVVSVCPEHRCLLADRCPGCQRPVSIRAIVDSECFHCKADLVEAAVDIGSDELGLFGQRVVREWLTEGRVSDNRYGLPNQPSSVLYRILDGLRLILMSHKSAWPYFERLQQLPILKRSQKLTPTESFALYTTAFEALTDWPNGLYEFLEKFSKPGNGTSLYGDFRFLYSQWLQYRWKYPEFQFLQEVFDAYVIKHYSTSLLKLGRYRNRPELVNNPSSITLDEVTKRMGVSKGVILDLIHIGSLIADSKPNEGNGPWLINKQSVEDFLHRLQKKSVTSPSSEYTIDFHTASKMSASVGLNAANLLSRVATGRLKATWPENSLSSICFVENDLRQLVKAIKSENGWVSREEIAKRMGVKITVVTKWMDAGLITPVSTRTIAHYFDQNEVDAFVEGHVFSNEAAQILEVGVDVVQKWARKSRLEPVAGGNDDDCHRYLFRRRDVERLRPENRLTGPQLAKRLGLSRSQLWQAVD